MCVYMAKERKEANNNHTDVCVEFEAFKRGEGDQQLYNIFNLAWLVCVCIKNVDTILKLFEAANTNTHKSILAH